LRGGVIPLRNKHYIEAATWPGKFCADRSLNPEFQLMYFCLPGDDLCFLCLLIIFENALQGLEEFGQWSNKLGAVVFQWGSTR
jgi:hypothetical protein